MFAYFGVPYILATTMRVNKERARTFAQQMERTMLNEDIQRVRIADIIGPFLLGGVGFLFAGAAGGLLGRSSGL
jgi:hypothetical protein